MADMGARRRSGSLGWSTRVTCSAALLLGGAACAQLLDLPSDPQLEAPAEPAAPEQTPARSQNPRGISSPSSEPLASAGSGGAGNGVDTGSVNTPDTAAAGGSSETEAPPASSAGSSGRGGNAPDDAGTPPTQASDAGAAGAPTQEPEPEPEPEPPNGCVEPELVGPNGRCYLVVTDLLAWEDARDNCQRRGDDWDLAAIRTEAINTFIGGITDEEAWLGGSDANTEGTWRWVNEGDAFWSGDGTTGTTVNDAFDAWNNNEPNGRGASDCARTVPIIRTGEGLTWADLECFELKASICEGPALEL